MPRTVFAAPGAAAIGPYSHACQGGDLVFLSGQTPLDPATGRLVEGGIAKQTEQCFRNLVAAVTAAGLTLDDVVNVQVFLTNMDDFEAMNGVYRTQFAEPYPARTTIGVASLPRGARVEIAMVAEQR
jgi:2-iminobutanoate/2-iminopropanoate deaminase